MSILGEASEILRSAGILYALVHRCLRHVVESLLQKIINPLAKSGEVDIFYHSCDVPEITNLRTGETGLVLDPAEADKWLPEAKGIFESQEEFDRTVDWERMFETDPMRHCTDSEEAALAPLMNFPPGAGKPGTGVGGKTKTRSYRGGRKFPKGADIGKYGLHRSMGPVVAADLERSRRRSGKSRS